MLNIHLALCADLRTRILIFFRIISNYEISEGAFTFVHDTIAHSKSDKENMSSPLDNQGLGRIISSLWQGKVRSVRKGPRENRKRGYLNLLIFSSFARPHTFNLTVYFRLIFLGLFFHF